jgi:hypothetical protein
MHDHDGLGRYGFPELQTVSRHREGAVDASEVFRNAGQTAGIVMVGDNFISVVLVGEQRFG